MLKKKVIPIAKASIGQKCGECIAFARTAKFEKPCKELGIKHFSSAPSCYVPDPYILAKQAPDVVFKLGLMLKDFDAKEARVFMSLVKQIPGMRKNFNLALGQPVFFCIGNDYLSNYFRGYVLGTAEIGDRQVFVTSDLGYKQRNQPLIATLMRESVFTIPEFKKKKDKLTKDGRLKDPKPLFTQVKNVKITDDYVPPTMESAPAEWFSKTDMNPPAKSRLKKEVDGTLTFNVKTKKSKK